MKIIDLLNKIANGEEVPKKINYDGKIYDYEDRDYFTSDYGYLFDRYNVSGMLNDEVEIIEEEKKIPEILDVLVEVMSSDKIGALTNETTNLCAV